MKTYRGFYLITCLTLLVLTSGCGGTANESAENTSSKLDKQAPEKSGRSSELDACTLLQSIGLEEIIGQPLGDITPIIHLERDSRTVSQCDAGTSSPEKSIGLFLKYSADDRVPKTKAEVISSDSNAGMLGFGEETATAIRNGKDITGLGDLAFTYDLIGINLMVYWDEHYQMIVMPRGFGEEEEDIARIVAEKVIGRIK